MTEREQALRDAAKAVCGYCADPEHWGPAKKGTYPEWWHLSARGFNVRNKCSAWAIWHLIEKEQRGVTGELPI